MADKDILEFVQNSKNIIDADSDDENEMINAAPVPTSFEMRNVMRKRVLQKSTPKVGGGRGSLVVKVKDLWLACHEFEPSTAEDSLFRGGRCTLNMSRLKHPPIASSKPGLVRGTVVLLENSITVWITKQNKRMEVNTKQLYEPNCIEGVRSMALETHTVKRVLHSPFTNSTTGTVIQLGGNLSSYLALLAMYNTPEPSLTTHCQS
ncbi:hypothetical protein TNCV_3117631 [Trichonephila clavipes]|uniref:Uncharacterized protein n=1 Tax=Trichonephila clavipes TaxID=2585209 RepID=A0A8X7BGB3_TRICX|nr:hypothetical protein TNCV_3117631 [Trichonephila clavipes]